MENRIKSVRENTGLPQGKFAERLNITRNYLNLVENGKRNPSDRLIADICRIFHINENWMQTGEGDMYAETDDPFLKTCIEIGATDIRLQDLIMRFWNLSDESKQRFWDFVDSIPKKDTE